MADDPDQDAKKRFLPKLLERAPSGDSGAFHGDGALDAAVLLADRSNARQICSAAQQWQQKYGFPRRDYGKEYCEKVTRQVCGEEEAKAFASGEKNLDTIFAVGK